jgi:hypothetical protein
MTRPILAQALGLGLLFAGPAHAGDLHQGVGSSPSGSA